jgi:hypothetical protein
VNALQNAMKTWSIVGALVLLGALPVAAGARALPVPTQATAALELCSKVSWPLRAVFARPSESVLCMRGEFVRETLQQVREIPNPGKIKSLVITSGGGWILPAIEFAKLAERYRWLIVVNEKCLSSCANYLFLARTKKVVLPQSVIGWHGLPQDPSEFDPVAFEKYKASGQLGAEWDFMDAKTVLAGYVDSKEFLAERGIPPELGRSRPQAGHSEEYVARLQALGISGAHPFWSYGRKALEKKFKVQGIVYMWEPRNPEEGTELALRQFKADIFFFDLAGR